MKFSTFGILESLQNDDLAALQPTREITKKEIANAAGEGADQVRSEYINYFSALRLDGEFGAYAVLNSYVRSHPVLPSVQTAIQAGDYAGLRRAFYDTMVVALAALIEKHAFSHILLTDELPKESLADQLRILAYAANLQPKVQQAAAAAPAAPVIASLTPLEQCAKDWKELGSTAFKKKYMDDSRMRVHFDAAQAQGLI